MAKAVFHKGQRVWVRVLGTWSVIERVLPQWVKGVEEPLRVTYDLGLGREFQASELVADVRDNRSGLMESENWRIVRLRNKMSYETTENLQPFPGTFPVVVTEETDWGGWRVPAAEYDRDPDRIEFQARIMVNSLRMLGVVKELVRFTEGRDESRLAPEVRDLVRQARLILRSVYDADDGEPQLVAAQGQSAAVTAAE